MINETKTREARYTSSKVQNMLKEYGDILLIVLNETKAEFDLPINETTAESIGLAFARQQEAKRALNLFMKKLHSKADERN